MLEGLEWFSEVKLLSKCYSCIKWIKPSKSSPQKIANLSGTCIQGLLLFLRTQVVDSNGSWVDFHKPVVFIMVISKSSDAPKEYVAYFT